MEPDGVVAVQLVRVHRVQPVPHALHVEREKETDRQTDRQTDRERETAGADRGLL